MSHLQILQITCVSVLLTILPNSWPGVLEMDIVILTLQQAESGARVFLSPIVFWGKVGWTPLPRAPLRVCSVRAEGLGCWTGSQRLELNGDAVIALCFMCHYICVFFFRTVGEPGAIVTCYFTTLNCEPLTISRATCLHELCSRSKACWKR